jgi:periplasmic mercuric ion binding protein
MFNKIILTFFFTCLLISCNKTNQQETKKDVTSQQTSSAFESTTISLPSIKCSMCVKTITEALKKVDGIQGIDVNPAGKITIVRFDKSKTDLPKLEKAISDAGYDANATPRNRTAYENLPACCK